MKSLFFRFSDLSSISNVYINFLDKTFEVSLHSNLAMNPKIASKRGVTLKNPPYYHTLITNPVYWKIIIKWAPFKYRKLSWNVFSSKVHVYWAIALWRTSEPFLQLIVSYPLTADICNLLSSCHILYSNDFINMNIWIICTMKYVHQVLLAWLNIFFSKTHFDIGKTVCLRFYPQLVIFLILPPAKLTANNKIITALL